MQLLIKILNRFGESPHTRRRAMDGLQNHQSDVMQADFDLIEGRHNIQALVARFGIGRFKHLMQALFDFFDGLFIGKGSHHRLELRRHVFDITKIESAGISAMQVPCFAHQTFDNHAFELRNVTARGSECTNHFVEPKPKHRVGRSRE